MTKKKDKISDNSLRLEALTFEGLLDVIKTRKNLQGKPLSSDKEVIDELSKRITGILDTIYGMQKCTAENV